MHFEPTRQYDHRHWLLSRFLEARRKNPSWSLRAYAKRLGISHPALSEILSGKRPLTVKMANRLAEKLELAPTETRAFVRAALVSKIQPLLPDDEETNRLADGDFLSIDLDTFKAVADWYYYAILSLSRIDGARFDARWIAKRLGLSRAEAQAALDRLLRLNWIQQTKKGFRQTVTALSFYSRGYDAAIRNFIHQGLAKAGTSLDEDAAELRELSATVLALDPDDLPKAREAIKRFRRELSALLEQGKPKRVYALSVQLVPWDVSGNGVTND